MKKAGTRDQGPGTGRDKACLVSTYRVTACCHRHGEFVRDKKSRTYTGSDEREHPLEFLVCPKCRMWAPVTAIEEVTP